MGHRAIKVEWWLANNSEQSGVSIIILIIITFKGKLTSASPGTLIGHISLNIFLTSSWLCATSCAPASPWRAHSRAGLSSLPSGGLISYGFKTEGEWTKEKLWFSWWLLHPKKLCSLNVSFRAVFRQVVVCFRNNLIYLDGEGAALSKDTRWPSVTSNPCGCGGIVILSVSSVSMD